MSGGGESAPAPAAKPAAAPPHDPVEDLARKIFIELAAQVHSQLDGKAKPEHKRMVELSFRLAEAFIAGNFDFNTAARERREAKAKASVDVSKIEIDFGAISGKK
jgi:hypothetical protein